MSIPKEESSLILNQAHKVLRQAEQIVQHLESKGLGQPDFTASSSLPPIGDRKYDAFRIDLAEAAEDLVLLTAGPLQWLKTSGLQHHVLAAWQTALRFGYFAAVPLNGPPIPAPDLAARVGMDADRLSRFMKLLASQRCFREVGDGAFEHTALSAYVARNKDVEAMLAFQADEMFEAASLTATSIEKAPYTSDAPHSAFNLRFGMSPYQWYAANPERGARFASAMAGWGEMNQVTAKLRDGFPWGNIRNKTVVDVGGGSGHIAMYLAAQFQDLHFIVQDINPGMLSQGPKRPEFAAVEGRVSFMQHDFLQPQPVADPSGTGLFFIRQITHNYPDDVCVEILRALVPALERCAPDTGLLINDAVMPAPHQISRVEEYHLRQVDMAMLNGYAAKQRTLQEFARLLEVADERLKIFKVHQEGIVGLLEVRLVK